MSAFGQVVVGPAGSGKTTYCSVMQKLLLELGRSVYVVNLDPANDNEPYDCGVNVKDLITVAEVMQRLNLGPNGALVYCIDYLFENRHWLDGCLAALRNKKANDGKNKEMTYFLFDCPGQVELYTHSRSMRSLLKHLELTGYRLVTVQVCDSHYCADPGKFISVVLTCLSTMVQLETPHLNVLSKMDLLAKHDSLPFSLDFFTEVLDLRHLLDLMPDDAFMKKYSRLSEAICEVIENYSLVSFIPYSIADHESVVEVLKAADKATGYCFGSLDKKTAGTYATCAMSNDRTKFVGQMSDKYCQDKIQHNLK